MDDPLSAHPPDRLLRAFGLGQLEAAEAEKVAEHLDVCPDCSETMAGLADDTFVSLVRKSPEPPADQHADIQATVDSQSGVTGQVGTLAELPPDLRRHPRYEIVELIGRGGMGDVYKAQHKVMNRMVALKVIRPELVRNAAAVERFRREVQAAARLHHNNIVTAHDAEQAGDVHFLVMEFVDGTDLSQVVQDRGALPVAEACDYVRQAAAGLEHAHQLGMVHRDIKPHNLMLTGRGEIKILDFGLANFASEVGSEEAGDDASSGGDAPMRPPRQLTQMGTMMGTPDYIAPEQAADARTADIRSDIYSLGCTLSFLLTGKPVFEGASVTDKLKAHAEDQPPKLTDARGDIPLELQQVADRMLAKDPAQRFPTPAEVAAALEPFSVARSSRPAARQAKPRKKLAIAAAMLLPAVLLAGVIVYLATDTGLVEIDAKGVDAPGAKVVLLKDGQEYASFDVQSTQDFQTIRAGKYEVQLRSATDDVKINVWSKRGDTGNWGAPDDHERRPVVLYRGGGLLVRVLRKENRAPVVSHPRPAEASAGPSRPPVTPLPLHPVYRLSGHTRFITRVDWNPGSLTAYSAGNDKTLRAWDLSSGTQKDKMDFDRPISGLSVSPVGWLAAVAFEAPTSEIELWDLGASKRVGVLGGHTDRVVTLAFAAPLAKRLMSAAFDNTLRIWDVETRTVSREFKISNPDSASMSADGQLVAARDADDARKVNVWNTETGEVVHTVDTANGGSVLRTALFDGGRRLVTGSLTGAIQVWRLSDGAELLRFQAHDGPCYHLAVSPDHILSKGQSVPINEDQRLLVTSGGDLRLRVWNVADGAKLAEADATTQRFKRLAISPDGRHVITGGGWEWNATQGQMETDGDNDVYVFRLPENMQPAVAMTDSARPRGKWTAVSAIMGGKTVPREQLELFAFEFDGEQAKIPSGKLGQPLAVTFKIDSTKDPAQIDFLNPDPAATTPLTHGIYRLDGDRLRMTLTDGNQPRPAEWVIIPPPPSLVILNLTKGPVDYSPDRDAESKKLGTAAALEWLKLLDAGDYAACWDAMAASAKMLLTRDEAVAASEKNIKPLGKAESRIVRSAEIVGPINDKKNEIVAVTFETRFAAGGSQRERVTLIRDADGKWRVGGHALTPAPPVAGEAIEPGVNLIVDPSLEDTAAGERYPNGWGAGNLVPKDAFQHQVVDGGRTGKHGWMIEGDGQFAVIPTNRPTADRAFRYAARAWVKIESGAAQIKLLYFDAAGRYLGENRGMVS